MNSMTLQDRFPHETTSRMVIANALFHTCCTSQLCLLNSSARDPRSNFRNSTWSIRRHFIANGVL